jgi:hypothetical protein
MYGLDQDCRQLCEAASREKDPQKLMEYVERLNQLLAEREASGSQDTVANMSLTTGPVLTAA